MGRTARRFLVVALVAAAAVLAVPAPAQAMPPLRGSVSATFTDVCGFVKAEFVNADPSTRAAAFIRFSRNGKVLDSSGQQVNGGGGSATLYQVAAAGDQIHYEWNVRAGGGTESLDHTHVTPAGCAEPKLAVSLIDSCGPDFTISVANSGAGPADVLIQAPTLHNAPYTVPAGGAVKVTVPAVSTSRAWVGRLRPDAGGDTTKTAVVDAVQRAAGCGIPWPNDQLVTYTRTCDTVSFVLYALDMTGTLFVRRSGEVVLERSLDKDIYPFSISVNSGDVVQVGDSPPLLTYTHHPPAGCPSALAPGIAPPGVASGLGPSPSSTGAIGSPAAVEPGAAPGQETDAAAAAQAAARSRDVDASRVALIAAGSAVAALALGAGAWFLVGARRRRRPVWAVAFATASPDPAVHDVGFIPTMSVRWIVHPGSTAHYLREDVA